MDLLNWPNYRHGVHHRARRITITLRVFVNYSAAAGLSVPFVKCSIWGAAAPALSSVSPEAPITDSHVHFWDPTLLDYSWLRQFDWGWRRWLRSSQETPFLGRRRRYGGLGWLYCALASRSRRGRI